MSLATFSVHFVDSDSTVNFINGIPGRTAIDVASDYADIQIAKGAASVGGGSCIIESIRLLTQEALDWRIEFWDTTIPQATAAISGAAGAFNNWGLLGSVDLYRFPPSYVTGAYYATYYQQATFNVYIAQGLQIPYRDKQMKGQMHVNLCNLNGNAKSTGQAGQIHLRVGTIAAS